MCLVGYFPVPDFSAFMQSQINNTLTIYCHKRWFRAFYFAGEQIRSHDLMQSSRVFLCAVFSRFDLDPVGYRFLWLLDYFFITIILCADLRHQKTIYLKKRLNKYTRLPNLQVRVGL